MKLAHRTTYSIAAAIGITAISGSASAETLREALARAYQSNPVLNGARAGQRANDENVPLATSRGLPGLTLSGSYSENIQGSNASTPKRQIGGQLNFNVPIYQGGAVKNSIRAANSRVDAGLANLRGTEASLFSAVVGAYMDVLRDEAILGLNDKQVAVLTTNLEATRDRFEVGDLTRTDIAQSESRLALAVSQQESGRAQLIASRERYVQLVGVGPVALEQPPLLPNLPETPEVAADKAITNNPDLIAAKKSADASRFDVATARASRLPRVALVADKSYANFLGSLKSFIPGFNTSQSAQTAAAGVQLTIPLYQGGAPSAEIRQAQARSSQALEQVISTERDVIAQTRSAYASWRASNAVIKSSETAVAASTLSLEGVRAENSVGNRTILDILNAEQELLNAQVQLISARRNSYVAGFSLLAAMGQAEARDLGLDGGALYDPTTNRERVRNHFWDWGTNPEPAAISTRTVDTLPQTPAIPTQPGK